MHRYLYFIFLAFLLTGLLTSPLFADEVVNFQIFKISSADSRAVVKTPSGELKVLNVGDVLTENAKVIEIAEGRVVLERQLEHDRETIIIRFDGQHQRIESLRTKGDFLKLYKPITAVQK
jgi:hypothetical protein